MEDQKEEESIDNHPYSIKDAVRPLHPVGHRSNVFETSQERHRFSHLILEHGEKHIQDWAVIASSNCIHRNENENKVNGVDHRNMRSDRRSKLKDEISTGNMNDLSVNIPSPSINMGRIEGRLRLCSRSIVFEPTDISRAIVRCPFLRMKHAPTPVTNRNNHNHDGSNIQNVQGAMIQCDRHLTMKANNIIAPFQLISAHVEFRFHFLHSSPDLFFELSKTIFQLIHGNTKKENTQPIQPPENFAQKIDQMLKPMLIRPFDPSNFINVREQPLTSNLRCNLLTPLLTSPGCALVTQQTIYFQPATDIVSSVAAKAKHWSISSIIGIARRYHGLKDSALELFYTTRGTSSSSVLLAFETTRDRESVIKLLPPSNTIPCHTDRVFVMKATKEWMNDIISNFEYLLALNSAAGRTFHDLSRYPVFPWVIADYKSDKLDFTSDSTFRDLSKPVGALDEKRLEYFRTRYKGMAEMEHPFLYGTHYSAPGYVLYYLVRSMPEHMLCLQNGRFDAPDRMFHDIEQCFSSANTNHADVKELIPEFYDPNAGFDFLINARGLQLGTTQIGERVNDVILPPWARSGRDFIRKNRKALESEKCTKMLPHWIDLIFGFQSRGEEAKKASNLFHRMAYMGPADLKEMKEEEKTQAELQATEFGIVPDLLFCVAHPLKGVKGNYHFVNTNSRQLVDHSTEEEQHDDYSYKGFEKLITNVQSGGEQPWELLEATDETVQRKDSDLDSKYYKNNDLSFMIKPFGSYDNEQNLSSQKSEQKERNSEPKKMEQSMSSWGSNRFRQHHSEKNGLYRSLSQKSSQESSKFEIIHNNSFDVSVNKSQSKENKTGRGYEIKRVLGNDKHIPKKSSSTSLNGMTSTHNGWNMKLITSKMIHGDLLTGCYLLMLNDALHVITISLDGCLLVHKLPPKNDSANRISQRRSFYATKGLETKNRLSFRSNKGNKLTTVKPEEPELVSYRTHASTDPIACLAVATDGDGGNIVFTGGHNDIVLAYGINSSCALASIYSHRDAVTGIDLISRSSFEEKEPYGFFFSDSSTHLMVSGSWDATVKVWSVILAAGETVSIIREPLVELFDADASIVCISSAVVTGNGVVICAGCADGSFVVWSFQQDGVKQVVHKQEAKKNSGPCVSICWIPKSESGNEYFLFTGFGSGKIVSSIFLDNSLRPISKISLEVSIKCLVAKDDFLLAGCVDGTLRLIQFDLNGYFDPEPEVWKKMNKLTNAGINCLCIDKFQDDTAYSCAAGSENGNIALFSLRRTT